MSRIILLTGILWLFSQSIHAEQSQITSPDGKLSNIRLTGDCDYVKQ